MYSKNGNGKKATEKRATEIGQQEKWATEESATEKYVVGKSQHLCNRGKNGKRKFGQR